MIPNDSGSPVREGDIVADKYRVERVLGAGGMGVVVAAMHIELEERVALKFLLPEGAATPGIAARFAQEARSAAKVKSEHVARVIDVGRLPAGDPFMVMEYLDGEDLAQLLARDGALPVATAVGYVTQAARAIAEAHSLGIVHRDLKPGNLFLARRSVGPPIVKVLDFGISKVTTPTASAQLTKTSAMLGSPFYMSPEQLTSSRSVDHRVDVWALGVVLYELVAAQPPFAAETMPELVAAILQATPAPVSAYRPGVPAGLDAVLQRCLAKSPAERFQDVPALMEALAPFGPGGAGATAFEPPLPSVDASLAGDRASRADDLSRSKSMEAVSSEPGAPRGGVTSRRNAALAGIAVAALVLVAVGLGRASRVSEGAAPPPVVAASPPPVPGTAPTELSVPAPPPTGVAGASSSVAVPPDQPAPSPAVTGRPSSRAPARAPGTSTKPAESASAAPPAPRRDCDPPYVIDIVTGHRQYKPECLE